MLDYPLPKMQNQSTNSPQPPQREIQNQAPLRQTPSQQSPLEQLGDMSQKRKMETENALLRETLAMSAQNCEALMKQLTESQSEFQQQVRKEITVWQQNHMSMSNSMKRRLEEMSEMIEQYSQNHQSQLLKLENMNEAFIKSLNAVLVTTSDKLIAQAKEDFNTALSDNIKTVETIPEFTKIDSDGATDRVNDFNKNLTATLKEPKIMLDNHAKGYHLVMKKLSKVDGWRQVVFLRGLRGSIATPIVLFISLFF